MNVRKIQVWDFSPTFRDGPYAMSHVTQDRAYGRILCVDTVDGIQGVGEIVFAPSLSAEECRQRIADEAQCLPPLIGQDVIALAAFSHEVQNQSKSWAGVSFGIETACFDIRARRKSQSLANFIGGLLAASVDDYFSISERSVNGIRKRLKIAGPGCAVIQLKLGVGSLENDVEQLECALAAMRQEQILLADANGGWSVESARHIMAHFNDPRIFWEEPCSSYEENLVLAGIPDRLVLFDQCVGNFETACKAIHAGVEALCIKPAFLGSLSVAREVRDRCAESGIKMRIDGFWCGDVATAAILHLAIGAPPELLIAGCDLREPLTIEHDLNGVRSLGENRIAPPKGPGLGIDRVSELLGEPECVYF